MKATFKLINSYFWKTIYGPILAFIFPIMLLGILGNIMKIEYVYPGILALTMLFLGVLALPLAVMELKGSSLFKYIGSSPVNPVKFSIVIIFYYIFISSITGFIIMFSAMAIFPKDVFPKSGFKHGIIGGLSSVSGFFSFYTASFIHLILVISTGLAIATFAKTPQQALTIAIIIIIPAMFLSGMVVTVDIIAKSPTMQWVSRFMPFRYSTGNLVVATTPLDQLGNIVNQISVGDKKLIFGYDNTKGVFNSVMDDGNIQVDMSKIIKTFNSELGGLGAKAFKEFTDTYGEKIILKSGTEIQDFFINIQDFFKDKKMPKQYPKDIFNAYFKSTSNGDYTLFKSIFLIPEALNNSDNNIFIWNKAWSVRKVTDANAIKEFLVEYFRGGSKKGSRGGSEYLRRYTLILERINEGKFNFIDMFTKQSLQLYSIAERSLNLILPLVATGIAGIYINKKFSWSNR